MRKRRPFIKEKRELILKRDGYRCIYCDREGKLEVDHIIPIKHNGSDMMSNLVTSCETCNRRKNGNRMLPKHEEQTLHYVESINFMFGIDGDDVATCKKASFLSKIKQKPEKKKRKEEEGKENTTEAEKAE